MLSKSQIRREAVQRRDRLADRDRLSGEIMRRFFSLEAFAAARCVAFYIDFRSEVQTCRAIAGLLGGEKTIAVPYCVEKELKLFHLRRWDELAPGTWGILEPASPLREDPNRRIEPERLDLIVVPGVAFDRTGGRLGYGAGYYDRLLTRTRPDAPRVGVAFQCQLYDRLPLGEHDVLMHIVVTEKSIYGLPDSPTPGRKPAP